MPPIVPALAPRGGDTSIGTLQGLLIIGFFLFERYLWRAPLARRLVRRRIIRGTWKGSLASSWRDPETDGGVPPIEVFLVADQSYSSVSVSLLTSESSSRSIVATFSDPSRGQCALSALYMNTPRLLLQDRSRIHRGALMLEVSGTPPARLAGFYFTDRDTKGELVFTERSRKLHEDFGSAAADSYS